MLGVEPVLESLMSFEYWAMSEVALRSPASRARASISRRSDWLRVPPVRLACRELIDARVSVGVIAEAPWAIGVSPTARTAPTPSDKAFFPSDMAYP